MDTQTLRLATRGSPLALRQTELTLAWLRERLPQVQCSVHEMVTTGDKQKQWSLEERGGQGLFVKELEEALRSGEADVAVHSAKDLPAVQPDDLELAGYLPRAEVNDVLVVREDVATPCYIATSSPRRRAQLKRLFPQAVWSEIRGNVETRLKKVAHGKVEATVLAAAGLKRLGLFEWPGLVFKPLSPAQVIPAAGQGAIALQVRKGEGEILRTVLDEETRFAVETEKAVLAGMGGGCHTSIGVYCCNGAVSVFYEEVGMRNYPLRGDDDEARQRVVKEIVSDLGLNEES
ncbi:hydroxymethylbilane synthase [Ruficoccus amylovorans]|uniref:Hydroxymethylbilane synthase n=1 Tax=Ruficoccus amylovorans TaxID=1804625 RepID=A0A842HCE3_9BACT|nr:hydroxymethylbilane synthase [Ruficoccus amylovorans]MBC2593738.1 hydroxymethylbilane synthase [Ruficoccus amylovorans]